MLSPESLSLRVLIVDDHPDLLSMLDLMMQRRKYAVKTAGSGPEALELAPDFAPHVVVSDIGMPGKDGFQLMQELRATPDIGPFKSIALTGYDLQSDGDGDRAKSAGYDAHLSKPFEFEQLFEVIEQFACEVKSLDSTGT